ncbi:Disease resistance protein RGA2 [Bienertia sinuspersici]
MADLGISIAEKLLQAIGNELIKQVCDMWGYKSQLNSLKETVTTIQKVLLDADAKRELSYEERNYIDKLKDAVYDADDLFDEFLTLAELGQLRPFSKSGKFFEKVRCFFSSKNQLGQAYRMSREVKHIKKRLDDIADTHKKFGFSVDYKPISRRREETCSYVVANEIIGRQIDKEAIINMLLDHNNEELCCLTIVGVGGLGKTTVAQLVYNDERVKKEFPDLRIWVCVSDQDGELFDVKTILCKILEVVTHQKYDGSSTMELVHHQFQQRLKGQKYLLVLDDVWNEDHKKWLDLKRFLTLGQSGSKVVVTTRSERTGTVIGEKHAYKLKGLSRENSWLLFEMSAFDKSDRRENHHEFVEIGKKIVEKCYNIPLAIKVIGSLLFGQAIRKWQSFEDSGLTSIVKGDNEIMSILKLSYHNLSPSLKSCFSYCALFPKDCRIEKQRLIDLWMAQGYIMPLDDGQSIEDAAEEHFLILLRRCFFQNAEELKFDDVMHVKIHDLMHDVAQEVGNEEIHVETGNTKNLLGDKVRHVHYVDDSNCVEGPLRISKIRSFLCQRSKKYVLDRHIGSWICLRVLDLSGLDIIKLPNSIGKLLHLRYLNLSENKDLVAIPNAITRLYNLQTLLLRGCRNLKELPNNFCKLVNLMHLDLHDCTKLISMPSGMEKLSSLKLLPYFVVGKLASKGDELEALKALTAIRGQISIHIGNNYRKVEGMDDNRGGYLKSMKQLTEICYLFVGCDSPEAIMETLEPPSNLKMLSIMGYEGTKVPKWGRALNNWAFSLSHLVSICFEVCTNLLEVPTLSKLPLLKFLHLGFLMKLEYMEEIRSNDNDTQSVELFFPSLVYLQILNLEKLKGWWKDSSLSSSRIDDLNRRLRFSCLSALTIENCPSLTSFPSCPPLDRLRLHENNEKLQINIAANTMIEDNNEKIVGKPKLRVLEIDNMGQLKSLPVNCLTTLGIIGDQLPSESGEVESDVSGVFEICAHSLQNLQIHRMNTLRRLCGSTGLQHFTALESLTLGDRIWGLEIPEDDVEEGDELEDDDNNLIFSSIAQNLRSLRFQFLRKVTSLPEWISRCSSLKYLYIYECPALKSLPQPMTQLTSLQRLSINNCPELVRRCKLDGEDRPKIEHIRHIIVTYLLPTYLHQVRH